MAKVITVSRTFPSYHPKKGEPTHFVEKIWDSLGGVEDKYRAPFENYNDFKKSILWSYRMYGGKNHTIRSGKRWKTGDMASIRVWGDDINPKSGRKGPYHSKQITIASDVEVVVFDFEIKKGSIYIQGKCVYDFCEEKDINIVNLKKLAENDGLTDSDLLSWFKYPNDFSGQIICWNKSIKY